MKRFKKVFLGIALAFVTLIALASCSNVSKSYADKVNNAAKDGNYITYDAAVKDLGNECIDATIAQNGVLIAIKGMNKDNYKEKLNAADENTKFDFIVITVLLGKCQTATYGSGTAAEVYAAMSK